jgi:hypothetical protein
MATGREIYIFGKGERVCTPLRCVVIERERASTPRREREKASTLGKKRKNFNARGKKKELQCMGDKKSFNVREGDTHINTNGQGKIKRFD